MDFTGERFIPGKIYGEIEVEHIHRYESISKLVKNKIVLDAACGEGYGSFKMSKYAEKVYGIDVSQEAIVNAQKKYKKDNLEFKLANIEKLPFKNNSVDVVVSFETIEHVEEEIQYKFLEEIKRVLKENGILIISTPDKKNYSELENFNNRFHVKEFYYQEFENFLKKFFREIYIFDQGFEKVSVINNSIKKLREKVKYSMLEFDNNLNENRKYIIAVCCQEKMDEYINSIQTCALLREIPQYQNTLYLDLGDGYSEKFCIKQNCNILSKCFSIEFDLSSYKNIKSIRWDPIDGKICNIKISLIKYFDEFGIAHFFDINKISSNGILDKNIIKFDTFDPMIFISVSNITHLNIVGEWEFINYIDYENNYVKKYKSDISVKEEMITKQKLEIDNKDEIIMKQKLEIANKDKIIMKQELDIDKKDEIINTENLQISSLQNELKVIFNSTSWKITKPLRKLSKLIIKDGRGYKR